MLRHFKEFLWKCTATGSSLFILKGRKISFVGSLTCQWGETFQPVLAVSWPSGCCGQSCPHRSTRPPWLWAGEPWASPATGQSSALQHYSRFCLGKCIMHKQTVLRPILRYCMYTLECNVHTKYNYNIPLLTRVSNADTLLGCHVLECFHATFTIVTWGKKAKYII